RDTVAVGKLSGVVGTYSNVDPEVESFVCEQLGLTPTPASQVVARDRHAEFLYACAAAGASVESFALEIRHLQRTEVREVEEPFREGTQKGSSAMPHKRNPWRCEQLCGLARVLRANLQAGLEDIALWHERDISHSSVERIVLADSAQLAYYVLVQFGTIVRGMRVHPDRMLENLDSSYGLVFSQPVLLALVDAGRTRDEAYRVVQRAATRTWEERRPFRSVLAEDPDVLGSLSPERLDEWFESTADLAPNHLISSDPTDFPETAGSDVAGRAMLVRATQPVRLECIGRGYLFGSAWSEYEDRGTVYGQAMPSGLRQAERLPEPIFTATTKAESGHDEPLTDSAAAELVGGELLERIRDITLRVYG